MPQKISGGPPQKFGKQKNHVFDHFFRDFRTRHRISPERNVASTNQNTSVNLQYVPYHLTYFLWPLTQKRPRSFGSLRPTHENSAFSQLLPKKVCYKVSLCENFNGKVVATSFPYITVHRWIAGNVHINLKLAIQVTHHMKIQLLPGFPQKGQ